MQSNANAKGGDGALTPQTGHVLSGKPARHCPANIGSSAVMNLIILKPEEIREDGLAELSGDRARHIRKVLRAEVGKTLRIGMLNGPLGKGTVLAIIEKTVSLQCACERDPPPVPSIDVLLAMPRPKVMKRLWAQLAALGVGRIVLVRAEKVERFYFDSHVLEPGFYTKFLVEGLQQAGCTHLPKVLVRQRFKPFVQDELDDLFAEHLKLLADPSGKNRLGDFGFEGKKIILAIGPEGGWTTYELEMLQEHGFKLFSMGHRILRTDTACVALVSSLSNIVVEK
jgi:RsmE family RNA methyltransferase